MKKLPPVYYLDAVSQEEASTPLRLLLLFSFPPSAPPNVQAMRLLGSGELDMTRLKELVQVRFIILRRVNILGTPHSIYV